MKVLQIVESAYRGTLEEQDDTIIWLTQAMKGAGGDLDVLLRGNAVSYALKDQDASGLSFGDWKQTEPPRIDEQVNGLLGKGVKVYYVDEDASERGIDKSDLVKGVQAIPRGQVAELLGAYDHAWHW
ncbi:MAG: DsrE family protein [Proteobacteria bacterium]|nr:DsrE family protein [Pseudomonadota bacterium]